MVSIFVSIPEYRISEELYNGSRTLVYRGYQELDQKPVVIKLLKNPYPSFSELVQFRNQYTIAKNLNSPLIVQTYSLEPYQNGYALVMEDFGGISLKEYFTHDQTRYIASIEEFLQIAIALCNTLDILYRERIIHKDIKPANILINPQTKQVKLIDFSIASLLPRETQTLVNPNILEGTLAYISPEQTGRMNRGIDYRTDFYSLGVTFYELLTGVLPFPSNEPMELVHCHLAKTAPLVHEINPQIPPVLSEIVSKLMAKNAESRYQSALGLKFDLENCLTQLQKTGSIDSFDVGTRDVCDRFIIPDKLYGRETEVSTLLQAFERVSLGATEMMLVAGFSGIGKTAVVNEVHKPIVRQRGYFIKGKYDQFNRNIPFSAFVQAFRDLMGQLLSESDRELHIWKTQILQALGDNGQVIIEVIPELERIIGKQAPAIELSGTAAQNRFNLLFQKFIQVFTTIEHPLVMFLDDLQWADSASLNLMQLLMNESESGYLFVIGAYRDNEVSPTHPLMLTLDAVAKANATINTITLGSLSQGSLNKLVADTLNCNILNAQALTELIAVKTKGNPFFATQFLKALYQDGLIKFDRTLGHWQCDLAEIRTVAMSDDVVEFMASQLQKLPNYTQDILKLAACIGAQFDLNTLAIVSQQSESDAAVALWKAVQEGLIIPQSEVYKFYVGELDTTQNTQTEALNYKFLHDRIQQAAYSLIPIEQQQSTHLAIARLLHQSTPKTELETKVFEIVNHWNRVINLILDPEERKNLAQLNLIAGSKAKASTANEPALTYFQTGLTLLADESWQTEPQLTLALHEGAAEAAFLCGNSDHMEEWVGVILAQNLQPTEYVKAYTIQIQAYNAQGRYQEAIAIARTALARFNVYLPEQPTPADIAPAMEEVRELLKGRTTQDLLNLPVMTEAEPLAMMHLLSSIISTTYASYPLLFPFVILTQAKLSINQGNTGLSAFGYGVYGILLINILGDLDGAYDFGQLALQLVAKLNARSIQPKVNAPIGQMIIHCKSHFRDSLPLQVEGVQIGLEIGDLEFAGSNAYGLFYWSYHLGKNLATLVAEYEPYLAVLSQHNLTVHLNYSHIALQLIQYLQGNQSKADLATQREQLHRTFTIANNLTALHLYWVGGLTVSYLFGEIVQASEDAAQARQTLAAGAGFFSEFVFYFYDSLTALAEYPEATDKTALGDRILANQAKLRHRANHAPMNFQHKYDLVEAERYRVFGQNYEAADYYDRAISGAKANEYIQEEGLANELAAKFYLDWGKQRIASDYMIEAYYAYARWGAKAKVAELERRYPQLLASVLQQTRTAFSVNETVFATGTVTSTSSSSSSSSSSSVSDSLDLAAVLKASQSISGEIELEKLLSSLLAIVIENAGADKCVLMLLRDERLVIEGSIIEGSEPVVLQRLLVEESQDIPLKLIYKVKNNRQTVVLLDATADPTLANDPYIIRQQPYSILCSPVLHQGKLLGILYLENKLTMGVFTSDRVELLNLLCAQAAISLENARLYERSLENAQQLEQSFNQLSAAQSRFHNLVDNVPGVVYQYHLSADGVSTLTYISADCYNLYEITPEQATANVDFLTQMVHPEDLASYQQSTSHLVQTLSSWHWEGRIITPSGIIKWIHGESQIQGFADGSMVWDGLYLDISERKLAELALQQAQLQIVQSEKMSALGNLVAGVAHEINNPVGCIIGNVGAVQDSINDLFGLIDLYQEELPQPSATIAEELETIDLEYLRDDLPKLIRAMKDGGDRIKSISKSLRTFSRADSDQKQAFNLHEGIDSTILILRHRLKANDTRPAIEVVTNYGNLPPVECFPGQLNQVFMNILANAIDALDESNQGRSFEQIKTNPNRITITTSVENYLVKITILDNGKGMNESVKQKIFDHLFTTKTVGKGTGLGLAIARQIVESTHGGKLSCNSVLGEGTEFIIEIPV
ncbi:trifunctional serine/threonine-protein kinase/ATP-binding protein/sensor histidine kinase [Nostoc sp.]|uniref:trifunctional serine/threonine-protein kinase/ATP-binding protein/sensor histidine kinase n=1 Tax=Nostoc sp. TaxID=1180 RepID=UPI002FF68202